MENQALIFVRGQTWYRDLGMCDFWVPRWTLFKTPCGPPGTLSPPQGRAGAANSFGEDSSKNGMQTFYLPPGF